MEMLNISPEAVLNLRILWARENKPANSGIRLYISGFGFDGPEWSLAVDTYVPDLDECCDFGDFRVLVERELLKAVGGLDVQFEADGDGGGFLVTAGDPDVQALSGCGGGCDGCCDHCSGHCHSCDCCGD